MSIRQTLALHASWDSISHGKQITGQFNFTKAFPSNCLLCMLVSVCFIAAGFVDCACLCCCLAWLGLRNQGPTFVALIGVADLVQPTLKYLSTLIMQANTSLARQRAASHIGCSSPLPCVPRQQTCQLHRIARSDKKPVTLQRFRLAGHEHSQTQSSVGRPGSRQRVQAAPLEVLGGLKELPNWDISCAVGVAVFAYVWVKVFDGLATRGVLSQKLSRKLVHITSGPLFLLTWPLFSDLPTARFIAALIPSLNMVRLLAVGSGSLPDPGLVKSVSRSGDSHELLKGPLYYVLVLIGATLLFWRHNPAGLVAVSMMCGGDGLADIIGRKFGKAKLPWNSNKSWAGSGAMFLAGMAFAAGFIWVFSSLGYLQSFNLHAVLPYIAAVCGACTLVESLPVNTWFDDNLSVPLVAIIASMLVLPMATTAANGALPQPTFLQMLHLS